MEGVFSAGEGLEGIITKAVPMYALDSSEFHKCKEKRMGM